MFEEFFHKIKGDKYIWAIVGLLTVFSLLAVYSSTTTLAIGLKEETLSLFIQAFDSSNAGNWLNVFFPQDGL